METLLELIAALAATSEMTDAELAEADAEISAAAEALADAGDLTDADLEALAQAAETVEAIRTEAGERTEAAAARTAQAADAMARIRGADEDEGEAADEAEDDAGDTADEDETEDSDESDGDAEVVELVEGDLPDEAEVVEVEEAVAAAATPRLAPLTRVSARRPPAAAPREVAAPDLASLNLVAAANAPGVQAGQPIRDYDDLAKAFLSAYESTKGYRHGPRVKVPVVRAGNDASLYPESHQLNGDMRANHVKIAAAQKAIQAEGGLQAAIANGIQASGGICAPTEVRYDLPVLGSDDRPIRDGYMARFQADRGGVATLPPPVLEDLEGAVDVWSNSNDQNPSDPLTKPCLTVTCPSESESVVDAVTKCLEYGNFRARYFPEQIEAWMRLAATQHARQAEVNLLAKISTGSTAVTAGQVLGTSRDVLTTLDRAIAVWRYRHRDPNITLAFAAPIWLKDQIRTDLTRQLPTDSVEDTFNVGDARIDGFFRARGVEPTWLLDGESGQGFTVQGVGALQGWASTVRCYLAPAGSWLFLDGGTLDLGIVRDSTLNATNDVQIFAETFEGAHFHGVESWTLVMDTCPDGAISATVDIDPCTSGS